MESFGRCTLVDASNRWIRGNTSTQSCSKTCLGEFVGVAIARTEFKPMIVDSLIQASLEIGIPHIDEMIASKDATRNDFMLHGDAEYLASYFFIRCHILSISMKHKVV